MEVVRSVGLAGCGSHAKWARGYGGGGGIRY